MAFLSHVGLTVKNLERSLTFYRDVVGMDAGAIIEEGRNRMKMIHLSPALSCFSSSSTCPAAARF